MQDKKSRSKSKPNIDKETNLNNFNNLINKNTEENLNNFKLLETEKISKMNNLALQKFAENEKRAKIITHKNHNNLNINMDKNPNYGLKENQNKIKNLKESDKNTKNKNFKLKNDDEKIEIKSDKTEEKLKNGPAHQNYENSFYSYINRSTQLEYYCDLLNFIKDENPHLKNYNFTIKNINEKTFNKINIKNEKNIESKIKWMNDLMSSDEKIEKFEQNKAQFKKNISIIDKYKFNFDISIRLTLNKFYNLYPFEFNKIIVDNLIFNKNCHLVSIFKDHMIYDYIDEFLKRYYFHDESKERIPKISNYYKNYLKFFCNPVFRDFKANSIIQGYGDYKAEMYYNKNYGNKGNNEENNIKPQRKKNNENSLLKMIFDTKVKISIDRNSLTNSSINSIKNQIFNESNFKYYIDEINLNRNKLKNFDVFGEKNKEHSNNSKFVSSLIDFSRFENIHNFNEKKNDDFTIDNFDLSKIQLQEELKKVVRDQGLRFNCENMDLINKNKHIACIKNNNNGNFSSTNKKSIEQNNKKSFKEQNMENENIFGKHKNEEKFSKNSNFLNFELNKTKIKEKEENLQTNRSYEESIISLINFMDFQNDQNSMKEYSEKKIFKNSNSKELTDSQYVIKEFENKTIGVGMFNDTEKNKLSFLSKEIKEKNYLKSGVNSSNEKQTILNLESNFKFKNKTLNKENPYIIKKEQIKDLKSSSKKEKLDSESNSHSRSKNLTGGTTFNNNNSNNTNSNNITSSNNSGNLSNKLNNFNKNNNTNFRPKINSVEVIKNKNPTSKITNLNKHMEKIENIKEALEKEYFENEKKINVYSRNINNDYLKISDKDNNQEKALTLNYIGLKDTNLIYKSNKINLNIPNNNIYYNSNNSPSKKSSNYIPVISVNSDTKNSKISIKNHFEKDFLTKKTEQNFYSTLDPSNLHSSQKKLTLLLANDENKDKEIKQKTNVMSKNSVNIDEKILNNIDNKNFLGQKTMEKSSYLVNSINNRNNLNKSNFQFNHTYNKNTITNQIDMNINNIRDEHNKVSDAKNSNVLNTNDVSMNKVNLISPQQITLNYKINSRNHNTAIINKNPNTNSNNFQSTGKGMIGNNVNFNSENNLLSNNLKGNQSTTGTTKNLVNLNGKTVTSNNFINGNKYNFNPTNPLNSNKIVISSKSNSNINPNNHYTLPEKPASSIPSKKNISSSASIDQNKFNKIHQFNKKIIKIQKNSLETVVKNIDSAENLMQNNKYKINKKNLNFNQINNENLIDNINIEEKEIETKENITENSNQGEINDLNNNIIINNPNLLNKPNALTDIMKITLSFYMDKSSRNNRPTSNNRHNSTNNIVNNQFSNGQSVNDSLRKTTIINKIDNLNNFNININNQFSLADLNSLNAQQIQQIHNNINEKILNNNKNDNRIMEYNSKKTTHNINTFSNKINELQTKNSNNLISLNSIDNNSELSNLKGFPATNKANNHSQFNFINVNNINFSDNVNVNNDKLKHSTMHNNNETSSNFNKSSNLNHTNDPTNEKQQQQNIKKFNSLSNNPNNNGNFTNTFNSNLKLTFSQDINSLKNIIEKNKILSRNKNQNLFKIASNQNNTKQTMFEEDNNHLVTSKTNINLTNTNINLNLSNKNSNIFNTNQNPNQNNYAKMDILQQKEEQIQVKAFNSYAHKDKESVISSKTKSIIGNKNQNPSIFEGTQQLFLKKTFDDKNFKLGMNKLKVTSPAVKNQFTNLNEKSNNQNHYSRNENSSSNKKTSFVTLMNNHYEVENNYENKEMNKMIFNKNMKNIKLSIDDKNKIDTNLQNPSQNKINTNLIKLNNNTNPNFNSIVNTKEINHDRNGGNKIYSANNKNSKKVILLKK